MNKNKGEVKIEYKISRHKDGVDRLFIRVGDVEKKIKLKFRKISDKKMKKDLVKFGKISLKKLISFKDVIWMHKNDFFNNYHDDGRLAEIVYSQCEDGIFVEKVFERNYFVCDGDEQGEIRINRVSLYDINGTFMLEFVEPIKGIAKTFYICKID